jgi:ribosomal protein S18 acetylase RimI-like enzyme
MSAPVQVRTAVGDDWAQYREVRLEMLTRSPDAFTGTLVRARRRTERGWRRRLRRNSNRAVTVAAIESEQWIGTASAHLQGGGATLVAVYVAPDFRGARRGVLDALLDAIERWAAERVAFVSLLVHEDNLRARRAYEKRGYELTGRTVHVFPRNRRGVEAEMRKRIAEV